MLFFFFKQKTAYAMRISDWSSDVCSSDLRFPSFPRMLHLLQTVNGRLWRTDAPKALHLVYSRGGYSEESVKTIDPVHPDESWKIGRAACRERGCKDV